MHLKRPHCAAHVNTILEGFSYGVHVEGVLLNLLKPGFQNVGLCGTTDKEMDGFNLDPDP